MDKTGLPRLRLPAADSAAGRLLRAAAAAAALLALVLAVTWPWGADLAHSFADHWDPPLHAWKVWSMADAILHGRLLPPGTSLNAYYPSAGSLYYESLYWPQGVVAAPVLALTGNPVLAFHASYLLFWVLSALCFGALLRELGAGRAAVAFGAAAFAILPVRTGYVAEFNMQLGFGIPLALLFAVRWSRTRRPAHAALAAGALCLQATSEMYTAVFFGLCLPLVLAPFVRGRVRELLRDRRTWLSALAAAATGAVFAAVFFLPYLSQLGRSVSRSLQEVSQHGAEPLTYLASGHRMTFRFPPDPIATKTELCLYPTLAVLALAAGYVAVRAAGRIRAARGGDGDGGGTAAGRAEVALRALRAALFAVFLAWPLLAPASGPLPAARLYGALPVAVVLLSCAIPFVSSYRDEADRLADGLCGAAFLAFFLSFGPVLAHKGADWSAGNLLYALFRNRFGFLEGFRVVSRFGSTVLLFLQVAAALALAGLAVRARRHGGRAALAARWLWVPLLALVVAESVPKPTGHRSADPLRSPVLDRLDARSEPYCLLTFPAWVRYCDSGNMFRIGRTDRLLVSSWGGAFPAFSVDLKDRLRGMTENPGAVHEALESIWPECLVLLCRGQMQGVYRDPAAARTAEANLLAIAEPVDGDDLFELYRLRPRPPAATAEKAVRPDLVARLPVCRFSATPAPGGPPGPMKLELRRNGETVFTAEVPEGGADYAVRLPSGRSDPVDPDRLLFVADRPFVLASFRLADRE